MLCFWREILTIMLKCGFKVNPSIENGTYLLLISRRGILDKPVSAKC